MTSGTIAGIADEKATLGQVLRRLRKDRKLNQEDVSKYLGVERVTCSAYETDRVVPPADKLYKLAEFYGISIELLASKTLTKSGDKAENELVKSNEADLKSAEMMYYYKRLDDKKKRIVFDLIRELYGK